ncbi:hypothetical protein [Parasutterella sp.]|jgi:hypothetical protein|uniref:hypothetical protein n=1 Tax=Parasutterella sp. TaxID=2049037 RepID=UPI00206C14BC|nr:MAG TPA: hypothetical protein [Caudoviricetes sp.]
MGIIPIEEAMKLSPTAREICLRLRKMSLDKIWYACLEQTHDREQAVELYTQYVRMQEDEWRKDQIKFENQSARYKSFKRWRKKKPYYRC